MTDNDYKGFDKVKHAFVCFALSTISPMFAIGAAIGKEFGDRSANGNHWCWWDIAADAVGIAVGYGVHIWSCGWHNCFCLMW